jgi:hypothetical protein
VTPQQTLEKTVQSGQLAASRSLAKYVYAGVQSMPRDGQDRGSIHSALGGMYHEYRAAGRVVEHDAISEVLDGLDEDTVDTPA